MQSTKSLKVTVFILLLAVVVIFSGCGGTIPSINHSPTIVSLTADPPSPIEVNQSTTITCIATDQDGDALTYNWTKTGGTITGSGSTIIWTAPDVAGTYTITCTASDGESFDDQSILIVVSEPEPINQAPVIALISDASVILGETFNYTVIATDPDGDTLTCSLITNPSTDMTIVSATGAISWTPTATGSYDITVEVSDGSESITQSFTITVDKALLVSIEVLPVSMTLEIGESKTIDSVTAHYSDGTEIIITPLTACTYESSKPSVATVNLNGVITGISSCTASTPVTITVTYTEEDIPVADTVSVVVTNPFPG